MNNVIPFTADELDDLEDPGPVPGDLADFLDAVESFTRRFVAYPSEHEPVAVALWIAHAHLVEDFETSPILAVTSAEMRSGKTRQLDVVELLVPHPFRAVIPSEAVTYTVLSQQPRPTLLLDEADAIFGPRTAERYEGLRAILNAGNRRGSPVLRVKLEGKRREVESFDVFGPKAVAGIGDLPATVADRSIPIRLKRRALSEPIAKFRRRTAEAEQIRLDVDAVDLLPVDAVVVPDELPDRAADSWEVLLTIAETAGGTWPARARAAAIALSAGDELPVSTGMKLLADVKDIFGERDYLTTVGLLDELHAIEGAPWGDWYGKPMTARALAKLLAPYRVGPRQQRVGAGEKVRGYFRADFLDVWERYVPGEPGQAVQAGPEAASVPDVPDVPVPQTPTEPALWDGPIEDDAPRSAWDEVMG